MNREYTLHDDTARELYFAARWLAVNFKNHEDTAAAAETLAAQNPELRE